MRPSSRELALHFGARKAFDLPELDAELKKGFSVDIAIDFVSTDTSRSIIVAYITSRRLTLISLLTNFIAFKREVTAVSGIAFASQLQKRGRIVIVRHIDTLIASILNLYH